MPKIVDHEARRWHICATAARLIAESGLEAATIRDIATASGHSKGVVEHYFDGKDELIAGALDWANRSYERRVAGATEGVAGLAALRERINATLPLSKVQRDEWKVRLVFWSLAAISDELRRQQAGRFTRTIEYFAADIRNAAERGEISPVADATTVGRHLVNTIAGICVAALHNRAVYTRAFLQSEAEYLVDELRGRAAVPLRSAQ